MTYFAMRLTVAAICGLVMGAYTNTLEYRLRSQKNITDSVCRCTSCGGKLSIFDQIPVISWVILRGKCRNCNSKISIRYPLVEGGTMMWYILSAAVFSPRVLPVLFLGTACIFLYIFVSHRVRGCKVPFGKYVCGVGIIIFYQIFIGIIMAIVNIAFL